VPSTLVVRVLDVLGAAVNAKRVAAIFDSAIGKDLARMSTPGAFEIAVPATATRVGVVVEHPGFWDVVQNLRLNQTGTPTLSFDGEQAIGVRTLSTHSRDGGGFNVEVIVVLGQLRDAESSVDAVRRGPNPRPLAVRPLTLDVGDLDTPILTPRGSTAASKNSIVRITPRGRLLFAERPTPPRLVAIYDPVKKFPFIGAPTDGIAPQQVPINYHIFFHPNIPAHFTPEYPFSFSFIDLIDRYMLQRQHWAIGKAMVNQHDAAGGKCVFIFPVGGKTESFGDLTSQASALRLLEEVNYFIQRMDKVPFPLQPVGDCAISGFSAGIRAVHGVLTQGRVARFNDRVLRDVYNFDGVFATRDKDGKERVDTQTTLAFCSALKAWFRAGDGGRSLRVYSQNSIWLDQLRDAASGATLIEGRDGAREIEHPRLSVLFTPSDFWDKSPPAIRTIAVSEKRDELYKSVHQFVPAFFMEHALKQSAMVAGVQR